MLCFTIKCRFVFFGGGIGVIASPSLIRHCDGVSPWQSFEWCLAVTRLPRHFVPRSDEEMGKNAPVRTGEETKKLLRHSEEFYHQFQKD